MALVLKDRVKESSTTSGTGTITLGGAFVGFQTFNTAVASGSTVYYTIHNTTAGNDQEWEVGVGTFTAPDQLTRDTVFSSSTGGSKVSFSGSSVLEVFITQPAEQAVYINDATGKVEVFGNGTNVVTFTEINTTNLTANTVTLTAGTISTNAANATDITNKQYVDGLFSTGISYHDPVRVESPTALSPVTYNNGSSGVGATLTNAGTQTALVIDGITLSLNDRVLIYTQTDQKQNGIYTVTNVGSGSTNWVLTRATDADTYGLADPNALGQGDAVFVQQGNTGAGETYICNTPGTIVFGTTNITFAQISSAQVYSAGTGLSLTNTTFSISNTAVTAAQYGNDGNVAQITVNAQGQLTNAANVAINASSITVGTLANARTTASDANGASTIVARDATGSFTANTITATTSNATTFNGTTGSFTNVSGNGAAISAINASNISSGTIANARTTASSSNSASTIVARDANGSFGANIVSASFSGDGSAISAINASNISSGTIANARTTAASANGASTIVQRDSGGNFSANTITANISGDISGGTNINASNITSGTIANARTTASSSNGASTIVLRDASGAFAAGAITGASFSGNGAAITAINASAITTGTLDNARTSASSANGASTIVARDANGSFAGNTVTATTGSFTSVSGNGVALTAINASNIASGTIANARTTASDANGASTIVSRDANGSFTANVGTFTTVSGAGGGLSGINASNLASGTAPVARLAATGTPSASTFLRGDSSWAAVPSPNNGTLTMNTSGTGISGSATFTADQSGNTTFTVTSNASSANGANTLVSRGASGEFSAGAITATSFSGSGASLTNIPNSATTAASANGASTIVARDANGSFTANVGTFTTVSGAGGGLTGINASNISAGTIANARTTASDANGASTIVARDASGNFTANVVTATNFSGGGGSISAINASNLSSGTVATARLASGTANSSTYLRGDQTWATVSAGTVIPAGTVMIFGQTAAPTGFTKDTTNFNNSALRVVTGTASSGGSVDFTTAFASQTPTGSVSTTVNNTTATNQATTATNQAITPSGSVSITSVAGSAGATTLSTPQIPSHNHGFGGGSFHPYTTGTGQFIGGGPVTTSTGGGGSHTHPFSFSSGSGTFSGNSVTALQNSHNHTQDAHNHTASSSFSGNAINLAVRYVDVIRATKD